MTIGAVLAAGAGAIILSLMGAFRAPRCWLSALLASSPHGSRRRRLGVG